MKYRCGIAFPVLGVLAIFWGNSLAQISSPLEPACNRGFVLVPFISEPKDPTITPKCYRFFNMKLSFEDAQERCDRLRSTLATPKHQVEAESLANYVLNNRPQTKRYWIGLSDQEEEGIFKWDDDGSKLPANFSAWTVTEPDSGKDEEESRGEVQDCVKMAIWIFGRKSSAQFYDSQCNKMESFVCEKETINNVQPVVESKEIVNATHLNGTEVEVDFIVPKSQVHLSKNMSEERRSNESQLKGQEADESFPMKVTAEYEEFEEAYEPGSSMVNTSIKVPPEVSDLPSEEQEAPVEPPIEMEDEEFEGDGNSTKLIIQRPKRKRTCSLECLPNHMRAACSLEYFPQMKNTKVVLNNATCRPRRNRTHLIVFTKLDHCGTIVENVPKKNKVSFKNTIHVITSGAGIVRDKGLAKSLTELMVLDCRYPQRHSVSHNFHPAEGKPPVYKTQGEGEEFNHVMLLYKTKKYECPYAREEYPVEVQLSRRVFLEVTLNMQSEMVELHPVTCFATPDANPYNSNNYVLMQDGCVEDETFQIEDSDSRKVCRFSMEAFRFVGYFRQVYIHCKLIVCRINSQNSPECPYACDPDKKYRRRRSEEDDFGKHERREISGHSGMIEIVNDDTDNLKDVQIKEKKKDSEPEMLESSDTGGENSAEHALPKLILICLMHAITRILFHGH